MKEEQKGIIVTIVMFTFLGLVPIYFKSLSAFSPLVILCLRVLFSFILLLPFFLVIYFKGIENNNKKESLSLSKVGLFIATSFLTGGNWWLYIWAINNGKTIEASLGYFISPILSIMFGMTVFGERITKLQKISIVIVCLSVGAPLLSLQGFPYIAFSLALTYSLYGLLRKFVSVNPICGFFYETLILLPFAITLIIPDMNGICDLIFKNKSVLFAGLVTCIPLLLFGYSISRVKYSVIGSLQYIGPTIIFLVAVFFFDEKITRENVFLFVGVWSGVFLYLLSYLHQFYKLSLKERLSDSK